MSKRNTDRPIYEPATEKQTALIETLAEEAGITWEELAERVTSISGLPSHHDMSKGEASALIDWIKTGEERRPREQWEGKVDGGAERPTMRQVFSIRESFGALRWNEARRAAFIQRAAGVPALRHLTRKGAWKLCQGLNAARINRM